MRLALTAAAIAAPLILAGTAAAAQPPRVLFHALGHKPVAEGTPKTIERFQLRNLEYRALRNVTIGFLFDDGQEPVSISCGFGGVQTDKETCTYASIPARFLVQLSIRVALAYPQPHPDHFTTIGTASASGWNVADTLIVPIAPAQAPPLKPSAPEPTFGLGGLGVTLGGGVAIKIG